MTTRVYRRKLAALLVADAQGYSRLLGEDEQETVTALRSHLQAIRNGIEARRGRVVDTAGDGLLAEFASVVEAVQCAVDLQETIRARNEGMPACRRMEFRIGINLGDVIEEDGRLYGDGVNLAARMQQLAEGGGICVSGAAYDQVRNKLPFRFEYQGEQAVRNIANPERVYRVVPGAGKPRPWRARLVAAGRWKTALLAAVPGVIVALVALVLWNRYLPPAPPPAGAVSGAPRGLPLPQGPSIAVLPFENLSGDPGQEYLNDGLTDDIITSLSKLPRLFVISRSSTLAYKQRPATAQRISRDLGVGYVLEGSVQRAGKRLRVNAQLIDGTTGNHVWAERYDRNAGDLFETRDRLVLDIATALAGKLTDADVARLTRRYTPSLAAWEAMQRGRSLYERYDPEQNLRAREQFRRVVEIDPKCLPGWAHIGWTYYQEGKLAKGAVREEAFRNAVEIAENLKRLDPSYHGSYFLLSFVQSKQGRHDESIANGRKAIELAPTDDVAAAGLAAQLNFAGEPEEAIFWMERAIRRNPNHKPWYLHTIGLSHHLTGRHDRAIEALREAVRRETGALVTVFPHVRLAAIYAELDRDREMRAEAAEVLRIDPEFSVSRWTKVENFKDPGITERRKALLLKAGLPP